MFDFFFIIFFFRLETETFESLRLFAVVFTVLLKIFLMPWYLQTYLNIAHERVEKQKKEAGRITNVDFQKKVLYSFFIEKNNNFVCFYFR